MDKFETKIGKNGLDVYHNGTFMGVLGTVGKLYTFRQWSGHEDQIYDIELAKEFLITYGFDSCHFKVHKGNSTATQKWFCIDCK